MAGELSEAYTVKQAAVLIGVGEEQVRRIIAAGAIRASNISLGEKPRYSIAAIDLAAFLDSRANRPR